MAKQSTQESAIWPVQRPEKRLEKRSQEGKIGRLKYNQFLLKRVLFEIRQIREAQRVILNGLKGAGYFHFDIPLIQRLACVDEVDLEILERLHTVGREGILPKDVAADLPQWKMKHYNVSRRILRMNKRLEHETGERLFEKRGWKWALTRFAFESYGDVEKHSPSTSW
jgi:ATP-dependent RNA circularization protein (DNA/RNA ligase family)